jgi:ribosomal protein S18 acetylase RimI-like enzyme
MTSVSQPQVVRLRSGDLVRIRQVRPGDGPALTRAYAKLSEESRYLRFFTAMPELSAPMLRAATEVDENHEALVALPMMSGEIVGVCRCVRLPDRPDTADLAVTVADAWQGRGLGSAMLARLSALALATGIAYFQVEILAENRAALDMLPKLGQVETEASSSVVGARIEIAEPAQEEQAELRSLLSALARGAIIGIPAPFRQLARVPDLFVRIVRLPVIALRALLADPEAGLDEADPGDLPLS